MTSPISPNVPSGQVSVSFPPSCTAQPISFEVMEHFHGDVYFSDCEQASSGSQSPGKTVDVSDASYVPANVYYIGVSKGRVLVSGQPQLFPKVTGVSASATVPSS